VARSPFFDVFKIQNSIGYLHYKCAFVNSEVNTKTNRLFPITQTHPLPHLLPRGTPYPCCLPHPHTSPSGISAPPPSFEFFKGFQTLSLSTQRSRPAPFSRWDFGIWIVRKGFIHFLHVLSMFLVFSAVFDSDWGDISNVLKPDRADC
jgi:hypothetical protein